MYCQGDEKWIEKPEVARDSSNGETCLSSRAALVSSFISAWFLGSPFLPAAGIRTSCSPIIPPPPPQKNNHQLFQPKCISVLFRCTCVLFRWHFLKAPDPPQFLQHCVCWETMSSSCCGRSFTEPDCRWWADFSEREEMVSRFSEGERRRW